MRIGFIGILALLLLALASSAASARTAITVPAVDPGASAPIVFVDALKQSTPWRSVSPLRMDLEGDVLALSARQVAERTVYAAGQQRLAGDYLLLYDGRGAFAVSGARLIARSPGRGVVRVGDAKTALVLRLVACSVDDPVRDVRLILPGFETTYEQRPFYPPFVASLRGADVLRFDAWSRAGTLAMSQIWPMRPRAAHVTQADVQGVAPEYAIELSNETGASPWFALPAGATDGYVYGVADLVHRFLEPSLQPIFQYADASMADASTALGAYALMAGKNTGMGTDPRTAPTVWYERRSSEVREVINRAFGADARRVSFVSALGAAFVDDRLGETWRRGGAAWTSDRNTTALDGSHAPAALRPFNVGEDIAPDVEIAAHPPYAFDVERGLAAPARPLPQPARSGVLLEGAFGDPQASTDLEREGSEDWVAIAQPASVLRRPFARGALGFTIVGRAQPAAAGFSRFRLSASSASAGANGGIQIEAGGRITVWAPAAGAPRVLRVYFDADHTADLHVTYSGRTRDWFYRSPKPGIARESVYTLIYGGASPGRVTVSLAAAEAGRVALRAASLAPYFRADGVSPQDEPEYHNGLLRTGWNPNETVLTVSNVGSTSFGLIRTLSVDGDVLAQPLFLGGLNGHDVVYVATEHDSVYAFDANSGALLAQTSLGTSQNSNDVGCLDIRPEYGITSTPVIDRTSNTMYVVAATEPSPLSFRTELHALDLVTLKDKQRPVEIRASTTLSNGSGIHFKTQFQQVRSSLALANGSLYLGIGSHCDTHASNITGWVLRYDGQLHLTGQFATDDDAAPFMLSSVWMTGFAPMVDENGDLYVVTGNGAFDHNTGGKDYGESALKLAPDLSSDLDYFTPANWQYLNSVDGDFGSGGIMGLPTQQGSVPSIAVAMGKDSKLYVMNRDNLGGLTPHNSGVLQQIARTGGGLWGGPAYYSGPTGQFVYVQAASAPLLAYAVAPDSQGIAMLTLSSTGPSRSGYGGSMPIVSSNGQAPGTGVVWLVKRSVPLMLEAYDATDVSDLLFSGDAGTWSNPQNNAFLTPLVAGGQVYVPASGTVTVFGLLPGRMRAGTPSAPARNDAMHEMHGVVEHIGETQMTLRLRDGRTSIIDIREARATGRLGPAAVGRPVVVYGIIDAAGVFHATSIGHTSPNPADWTPDR